MNKIKRLIYGKAESRCARRKHWVAVLVSLFFALFCIFPTLVFCAEGDFFYIQVGSFKTEDRAVKFSNELKNLNYETVIRYTEVTESEFWNRVFIGPYEV